MLESLDERGELDTHVQPEVFPIDPKKGWPACRKCCTCRSSRGRSKASTSPISAAPRPWPAWCSSSTGCRSSRATGGCRIRNVRGGRRLRRASTRWSPGVSPGCSDDAEAFPDILLIDGGKGQLHAALSALDSLDIEPPVVLSLAKREELVFVPGQRRARWR